jgi:F0F1-type ATP synthase delta subunit
VDLSAGAFAICAACQAKPKFAGYITNPTIPKTVKKAAIADIAKQHKFSDVTVRFLGMNPPTAPRFAPLSFPRAPGAP